MQKVYKFKCMFLFECMKVLVYCELKGSKLKDLKSGSGPYFYYGDRPTKQPSGVSELVCMRGKACWK